MCTNYQAGKMVNIGNKNWVSGVTININITIASRLKRKINYKNVGKKIRQANRKYTFQQAKLSSSEKKGIQELIPYSVDFRMGMFKTQLS